MVMKCDDDDVPMENENNVPFAGCCVIFWGEDDT